MSGSGRGMPRLWWGALALTLLLGVVLGRFTAGPRPSEHSHGAEEPAVEAWTCSMHPQIQAPDPGACPICGMDLIPAGAGGPALGPEEIELSARARTLARIQTSLVRRGIGGGALDLLGRVAQDESRVRQVPSWIAGRVDRLLVRETGQRVWRGQPIARVYSPQIYAAHQDLLIAQAQLAGLPEQAGVPEGAGAAGVARRGAQQALEAARQRLRLLGMDEDQLEALAQASAPTEEVTIRSPYAGTVTERLVSEGSYVREGEPLYRLADLSRVWVELEAYEADLPRLAVGQEVELSAQALPGLTLVGHISFIDPQLDPLRRVARVRVEAAGDALRPGLFVSARVHLDEGEGLVQPLQIPRSAPLWTGARSLVYVETEGPDGYRYTARTVELGPRQGDHYPVLAGLRPGERVVSQGAFVIDSDLQIRGGRSMMSEPAAPGRGRPAPRQDALTGDRLPDPDPPREALAAALVAYLDLSEGLAADALEPAREGARGMQRALADLSYPAGAPGAQIWEDEGEALQAAVAEVLAAPDLVAARAPLEALTEPWVALLAELGNPLEEPVRVAWCPMARNDQGGRWLQRGTAIRNAWFGSEMLACGLIETSYDPAEAAP